MTISAIERNDASPGKACRGEAEDSAGRSVIFAGQSVAASGVSLTMLPLVSGVKIA
jgi:hypothetical protein